MLNFISIKEILSIIKLKVMREPAEKLKKECDYA
jgi:hypothetical protein